MPAHLQIEHKLCLAGLLIKFWSANRVLGVWRKGPASSSVSFPMPVTTRTGYSTCLQCNKRWWQVLKLQRDKILAEWCLAVDPESSWILQQVCIFATHLNYLPPGFMRWVTERLPTWWVVALVTFTSTSMEVIFATTLSEIPISTVPLYQQWDMLVHHLGAVFSYSSFDKQYWVWPPAHQHRSCNGLELFPLPLKCLWFRGLVNWWSLPCSVAWFLPAVWLDPLWDYLSQINTLPHRLSPKLPIFGI